ncbi:hypothetical protein KSD_00510 [Ktedonobacter sp. SOSP1-85]|nr:hypothetical protein KSD_00510 [Ktedonobacter sp. SOSP1-85]
MAAPIPLLAPVTNATVRKIIKTDSYSLSLIALLVSLGTTSLQTGPSRIRQFGCNSTRNQSADGTNDYLRLNQGHD